MNSGEKSRGLQSGSRYGDDSTPVGGILGKYYKNKQDFSNALNYKPGGGLSKNTDATTDAYGIYAGNGLSGAKGGMTKLPRKDSASREKPPAYGGYNFGGGGISKYALNKNDDTDGERFPSVTNRQALGSGVSIGGRRNIGAKLGSKEGSRGDITPGDGIGGISRQRDSSQGLPSLNKYSNVGGLGGLSKGGLGKSGLSGVSGGGGLSKAGGLPKGGGLGRFNL